MEPNKNINELLEKYYSSSHGLTKEEAQKRLEKNGPNELAEKKNQPFIIKFISQFKDFLVIILLIAAVVSCLIVDAEGNRDWIESVVIVVVVVLNALIGSIQEMKAEKSLDSLKKLSSPHAKVKRDGEVVEILSRDVVEGDILIVEAGDFIVADCRIVTSSNLLVDESALTGESVPVNKKADEIIREHLSIGDMHNCLFSSTFVTYGKATALVIKTGMGTEIGKIARMLNEGETEQTPLQLKLTQIGKTIGIICIFVCLVVFALEMYSTRDFQSAFMTAIALTVASIPEGLATVVTVVLAIGVDIMSKRKSIVKKLPAVETLGCASIICSDKTGTLTQNKMTVVKLATTKISDISNNLSEMDKKLLWMLAACNDATVSDGKEIGDPTETALIVAQRKYAPKSPYVDDRVADLPFDSDRKLMTVVLKENNRFLVITKGAPDCILERSKNQFTKQSALKHNDDMANHALRVLGLGYKFLDVLPKELNSSTLECDLEFLGLVGMIDPARPEVKEAINDAKNAGIRTIMITGDHIATAKAIAKELNILTPEYEAISSSELHKMTEEEFTKNFQKYAVYARVAPEDKVRIVNAWQKAGHVVAMTGDGVNDSPALKRADIGCAMGITGTAVAQDAADVVLTDDNFETIVKAVEQGRGIYANIRRVVKYLLSSNIGEVLTIFLTSVLAIVLASKGFNPSHPPLLAMHLLWVNLITDTLPAFALGCEDVDPEVMKELPRPKKESFFANGMSLSILLEGIMVGLLTLLAYGIGYAIDSTTMLSQTMAFVTLASTQLFHAFNVKTEHSVFTKKSFNNKFLIGAFIIGIALQMILLYTPGFASIFKVVPLSPVQLAISLGLGFSSIIIVEIAKALKKGFLRN